MQIISVTETERDVKILAWNTGEFEAETVQIKLTK